MTPDQRALLLARRVKALPEVAMRARWTREAFERLPVEQGLEVLRSTRDFAVGRCPAFSEAWLAISLALSEPAGEALRRRLLAHARHSGGIELEALLDRGPTALVLNPLCPRDVALFLVPQLSRTEARRALEVAGLDAMVHTACLDVVRGGTRH